MNRTRFIQGLNSNIELSDKERRRAIRNSIRSKYMSNDISTMYTKNQNQKAG